MSSVSSIKDGKRGVPLRMHEDKSTYLGGDKKPHFKLDISNPAMPNFLPSEAQRLGTPPTPGEQEDWIFQKREFIFDYNAPPESDIEEGASSEQGKGREKQTEEDAFIPKCTRMERKHSETGWFSLQMAMVEKQAEAEKGKAKIQIQEFDIPEHLPTSPLCPKHPKHPSKAKGTCIFHGRNGGSSETSDDSMLVAGLSGVH